MRDDRSKYDRLAIIFAILTCAISFFAFVGSFDLDFLNRYGQDHFMAPPAALIYIFLSLSIIAFIKMGVDSKVSKAIRALMLFIPLLGLFVIVEYLFNFGPLERLLPLAPEMLGELPTGRISPMTAEFAILAGSTSLLLITRPRPETDFRDLASLLALLNFLAGSVIVLGYIYGSPFLYLGGFSPVALPQALAMTSLSIAFIFAAGPNSLILSQFVGSTIKARLMRTFLPLTAAILIVNDLVIVIHEKTDLGHALVAAISYAIFLPPVMILVLQIVRSIGGSLDKANVERDRIEESLRASEGKFRSMVEQSPDGIFIVDKNGMVIEWNRGQEVITGIKSKDAMRKPVWDILIALGTEEEKPSRELIRDQILGFLQAEHPTCPSHPLQMQIKEADGSRAFIQMSAFPIRTDGDSMAAFICRDLTGMITMERELAASEERYRTLIETSPDEIIVLGPQGDVIMCNRRTAELHGFDSPEEMTGMNVLQIISPGDRRRAAEKGEKLLRGESTWNQEYRLLRKDGSTFMAEISSSPVRISGGKPLAILSTVRDITERKQSEERRRRLGRELITRNQELTILHEISAEISTEMNLDVLLHHVLARIVAEPLFCVQNRAVIFTLDQGRFKLASALGLPPEFIQMHEQAESLDCLCGMAAKSGEAVVSDDCPSDPGHCQQVTGSKPHGHMVIPLKTADRVVAVMLLYTSPGVRMDDRRVKLLSAIGSQLGTAVNNAILFEEMKTLSLHDSLTGLANRNLMYEELKENLARARRSGRPFTVAMLDLDFFKRFNDAHGHTAGDRLLAEVARTIAGEIREADLAVRYGGEEFLIILIETDLETGLEVTERIRRKFEQTDFQLAVGVPSRITMSIGVTAYDGTVDSIDDIIGRADDALYEAKRRGRNRVVMWSRKSNAA